jgi:predicted ArsR family transcriptional regulator
MNDGRTEETDDEEASRVRQVRETLISELMVNAFDALLEIVPADQALETIRPYTRRSGRAVAANAMKRFEAIGNGKEAVALPMYWAHSATSGNKCDRPIGYEDGVIVEVSHCPVAMARPEICIATSHYLAEGICEAVNPEYELVFTHHIVAGDKRCRYVVRRKASPRTVEDLGMQVGEMDAMDEGEEGRSLLEYEIWSMMLTTFTNAALELKVIKELLDEVSVPDTIVGRQIGLFLINERDGQLDGPPGVVSGMEFCRRALLQQGESSILDSGVFGTISSCPFHNAPTEVCRQIEHAMNGLVEAIDPDLEFKYAEMMSKGDPCCHWSVHPKGKGEPPRCPAKDIDESDPVSKLSTKLLQGEISEEEYNRKVTLLIKDYLRD